MNIYHYNFWKQMYSPNLNSAIITERVYQKIFGTSTLLQKNSSK